MDDEGREELYRLVQIYRMPSVLTALAEIALEESMELRELRDAEETASGARVYRRQASSWEHVCRTLKRQAYKLEQALGG